IDHGIPRSTFEETLQYIADELNIVKDQLPEVQDGSEYGRVTNGAALGLLTKLYFFAASPLYNGGNTGTGNERLLNGYDDYQIS
ncbi:RagB/SusD family nutrient uptake outer membrane protein, partial [termite gut metagenome]